MSGAQHTPGVMKHASLMGSILVGFRDEAIFHCGLGLRHNSFVHEQEANARRLAACWNACAGVPVEVLEAKASGGLPWMVADQIDALAERRALVAALQPFVARNSSDETITITVRTADVAQARAVIAKATGITPAAAAPAPTTSRCPHCGDWLGEHDRDCIKFGRGAE